MPPKSKERIIAEAGHAELVIEEGIERLRAQDARVKIHRARVAEVDARTNTQTVR